MESREVEVREIELSHPVEYVDAICLDKSILLSDGCRTATITTADGESLPVTFIVSQPMMDDIANDPDVQPVSDCVASAQSNDGTILENKNNSPTVYTVHFPSDGKLDNVTYLEPEENSDILNEDKLDESNALDEETAVNEDSLGNDILDHQPDIDALTPVSRLEDFMDVVTTYKCKFCRFACPWKSGLMSHIRCCHIKERNCIVTLKAERDPKMNLDSPEQIKEEILKPVPSESVKSADEEEIPQEKSADENNKQVERSTVNNNSSRSEAENENNPDSPVERHIFLCGQCSDGFISLEECKQHMINDHNLKLSQDNVKPVRKRGRPRTRHRKEETTKVKKRVKKEPAPPKESKMRHNLMYKTLDDEFDCCIKRKLRTGYVNDRAFRCTRSGCGHRFTTEANLSYHSHSHSSIDKAFMCPECNEEYEHWRGLAMHLWREHAVDIDLHSCTECNYKTFSFFKLDNHRKIHSDERAYVCDTCGKGFKQISQLRNHIVIHLDRKNLPEKRWYSEQECETCGRKFSDTKCLRKHQQAVHSKLKPYICSYCGHLSARKAMLELHMRQHTGEKPFLCEHCDYRTGDHNSLRRHRMRHTGDKPYKCPHCPYACIQAISYKTHLRNKHPGMDGLFSCTLCTFKSVSKENFINHMSDHKRLTGNLEEAAANLPTIVEPEMQLEPLNSDQSAVQMQLTDNALQQLEGFLPGNITAAQLIYSCLNAMSQDGGAVSLPPGVTVNIPQSTTTSSDGTQTITIQLPSQETESEPYYFTIQQQDGTTALLLPTADQNGDSVQEVTDMEGVQLTDHDISSAAASLDCNVLAEEEDEGAQLMPENNDLVITRIRSMNEETGNFEIMPGTEIQSA